MNAGQAAGAPPRRLFHFNAGFLTQKRVRRILQLAGYQPTLGKPGPDDLVGVWGHSPYAARGEAVARSTGAALVRIEDAFLRSLHPGRSGEPPLGLVIDHSGMHFDPRQPSDLERLLLDDPLDDAALLTRARGCIARMAEAHLSKYAATDPDASLPDPGYVLVVDQTRDDASVSQGMADANSFREMLFCARDENPGARIVIKTHPETAAGHRAGYFGQVDLDDRTSLLADPVSPWALMEGAIGVYTVSSQMGFEAILAGHRPRVFGRPFYAGWGLTDDLHEIPRRTRRLTRAQLFVGAMMLYPVWYDPFHDRLCKLEEVIDTIEAQALAWRQDRHGWVASGMRLWKRSAIQGFFGAAKGVRFADDPARAQSLAKRRGARRMVWASTATPNDTATRIEDGFLRSRGLGAQLVPPLSLVCDDLGIYYDPTRESRLERLIAARTPLRPDQEARAQALIRLITDAGLSKYNLGRQGTDLPSGRLILVPGQVEDDASIRFGTDTVRTNRALLQAARAANPDAVILYKPHPDVEAGLRRGNIAPVDLVGLADRVLDQTDPATILPHVDEVWTMTSLLGFEALLRGVRVVTLGAPFYAGWGLTHHLGPELPRRSARPDLLALVHATLIDYPRYRDPVTGLPCPVEVVAHRLTSGTLPDPSVRLRLLSKLQGLLASQAHLWRR
ncbi:capsular polysaccharide biosynthesis protein [Lacimonas salitolerans]|uniref:Capsular polysaccharide biosynthesis protein n=1 Tax=Lacimonas salitolerans TaxID=1323750 RepID=A0ABW4ECM2_9RHOB